MIRIRAATACFLAYAVMSGMLAPMGIISQPLAETLSLELTAATASFSWLTVGVLGGAVLALFVLSVVPLRMTLLSVYALLALLLLSLTFADSVLAIGWRLAAVGVLCGLGLPGAAQVIAMTFSAERRTSMLVLTDGAFSLAGVVVGALASQALAVAGPWYQAYLFVAGAAIVAAVLFATLPTTLMTAEQDTVAPTNRWPIRAWWLIAALALYTLGQSSLLLWLPQFAQGLGLSPADAGALISRYWSGMFAAQLFVALAVLRLGERRLLLMAALGTAFGAALVVSAPGPLGWLVAGWGFANLALLKVVLGFAVSTTGIQSPRLISALLLGATSGTACGPPVSSYVVDLAEVSTALEFAVLCLALAAGILLAQLWTERRGAQPVG